MRDIHRHTIAAIVAGPSTELGAGEIVDGVRSRAPVAERSRSNAIASETMAARSRARGRLQIVAIAIKGLIAGMAATGIASVIASVIASAIAIVALPGLARADNIDDESTQLLGASSYKRRLAAALTLSKVHDGRAVRSLSRALEHDDDAKLRQVAALALAKAVTDATPAADRKLALSALERVARGDADTRVRELAARTLTKLDPFRSVSPAVQVTPTGPPPLTFIYVAAATDGSHQAPDDAPARLTTLVRGVVSRHAPELPTQWPGKLPTVKELGARGTKAYAVSATIAAIEIVQRGGQAEITCKVQVRVTPWNGVDGEERWVAHKAASASGQGRATTATTARAMASGVRDCVNAVAEEVTAGQVVPFLRKVLAAS